MRIEASEVKDKLYELLGKLEYGEENMYVITNKGRPVAILGDYEQVSVPRKIGIADGKFTIPEDFDAPDEEIEKMFGVI